MRSSTIVSLSALALGVTAFPGSSLFNRNFFCMSDSEAQTVATNFGLLLTQYSQAFADQTLTPDFTDYTDSVIELIDGGCTNSPVALGTATFSNRTSFEKGQSGQPAIPFKQLNIWHTCNAVTLRWVSAQTPQQVTGVVVLETQAKLGGPQNWLIHRVYSEFNSGAWLFNLGYFKPTCPAPPPPGKNRLMARMM